MRQMTILAVALGVLGVARAQEEQELTWDHEGYSQVVEAAAAAKQKSKRLLIGLSGSDT
ncbi:MAG: hypothetical protein ACE10D_04325 [Planctomycetota bacterium]|nr:hypothetical protein [Planctomycetota bacterium]